MATKIPSEVVARIKQLVDPQMLVEYLGFHVIRRTPKELRGPCKIHGGDNPTAFRLNLDARSWCCYTKHCEGDTHRDLVGLVQLATGQNFVESVKLLANIAGIDLENQKQLTEEFLALREKKEVTKLIAQVKSDSKTSSFYPEELVQQFLPNRSSYFPERGFPEDLLDFFQVGGTTDSRGVHRETIPIRDEYGNLLTVSARRTDSDEDPKYLLLKNISKTETLYNLDVAKMYVGLPRVLILVEGFVDVWNLALNGVWNVVAAMGTSIAPPQARLLSKYADEVLLMLDPDDAGREATRMVRKMLRDYVGVQVVQTEQDPKYLQYSEIKKLFGGMISNG